MRKAIILETEYKLGTEVKCKLPNEFRLFVTAFALDKIDENGNVIAYRVHCSDGNGITIFYNPDELVNLDGNTEKSMIIYDGELIFGDIAENIYGEKSIVIEILIYHVANNIVTYYKLRTSDGKGNLIYFRPFELNLIEINA